MTPYMRGQVAEEDYSIFTRIRTVVERMSDVPLPSGKPVSCHHLCRALADLFGIEYRDGHFGSAQHSWLLVGPHIVDPYPVGVLGGPILLETRFMLPWRGLYTEGTLWAVVDTPEFKRDLEIVKLEVWLAQD